MNIQFGLCRADKATRDFLRSNSPVSLTMKDPLAEFPMTESNPYEASSAPVLVPVDIFRWELADRGMRYASTDTLSLFRDDRRCIHDLMADAIVVKASV
ncbi:MAG: hypothetical protein Q8O00_00105 [Holophaga sp.]|nr:hypothetical protein [Holophaga sp.]